MDTGTSSGMDTNLVQIECIDKPYPGELYRGTHYILRQYVANNEASTEPIGNSCRNVVIVHGIGSYFAHFEQFSKYLSEHGYTVLTYDLIGRGYSEYPASNKFDEEMHINQLRDLIEGLYFHHSKYHIIGHSMGGALAALYADRYSGDISSMIVLSPAGLMDSGVIRLLRGCCSCFQHIVKSMQGSIKTQEGIWRADFHRHDNLPLENAFVDGNRTFLLAHPHVSVCHTLLTLYDSSMY